MKPNRLLILSLVFAGSALIFYFSVHARFNLQNSSAFYGDGGPTRAPVATRFSVSNSTSASRFPAIWVGDVVKYTVIANPNQTFQLCHANFGCIGTWSYKTNSSGVWTSTFAAPATNIGTWTYWVVVDGKASNTVTYYIVKKPVKAVY